MQHEIINLLDNEFSEKTVMKFTPNLQKVGKSVYPLSIVPTIKFERHTSYIHSREKVKLKQKLKVNFTDRFFLVTIRKKLLTTYI